jgi:hypothetical protein
MASILRLFGGKGKQRQSKKANDLHTSAGSQNVVPTYDPSGDFRERFR